jgi:uncharacterized membrane protein YagU involved in acid resistance
MDFGGAARSVGRGVVAGAAGTAVMTGYQLAVRKARGERLDTPVPRTWADAPAPAQVAKRIGALVGKRITKAQVPWVTPVAHWAYGVSWGPAYGLVARDREVSPLVTGAAFGTGVWAAAYAELVPLGIYEEPWKYPPQELALDLSYHVVYGVAVAAVYQALSR